MIRNVAIPFLFLALVISASARAQDAVTELTETNIQDYYRDAVEIFRSSPEEYKAFLERVMHEDFTTTAEVTVNLPNQGPVKQTVTKNKQDSIASAQGDFDASQEAELDYKIRKIKISRDGKSATVDDNATVLGLLVPAPDGTLFKADSRGPCEDKLVITEGIGIQTLQSKCTLEMVITPKEEASLNEEAN